MKHLIETIRSNSHVRRWGAVIAAGVVVVGGVGAYLALRPTPIPDFEDDPIDEVFNYALLTNEFNRLPIEERLELIRTMTDRLKDLGGSDSTLLAAFAAGIVGSAREQLEENAAGIAVDIWDSQAKGYAAVAPEDRAEHIEQAAIDLVRLTDGLNGYPSDISDEEIVDRLFEQAAEDVEQFREVGQRNSAALGRMFTFMDEELGGRMSPVQRARVALFVRDMSRHFRGADIEGDG